MKPETFKKILMIFCCLAAAATAAQPAPKTSPVSIYSGGAAIGVVKAFNASLKTESRNFFRLSFINDVYLTDFTHLFMDVDWLAPRSNFGMDAGLDILASKGRFRPFLGAGVGIRYFEKKGYAFGDNFGPSATVHAGALVDFSRTVQLRVRVPYHFVLNQTRDAGAGLDIGLLFSKPFRHVKRFNDDQD
jgi:opacity protein-like surface antigen